MSAYDDLKWYWYAPEARGTSTQADFGEYSGQLHGVTIARVFFVPRGEYGGGLAALVRFMAGAHGIAAGPDERFGWQWQATTHRRGVWESDRRFYLNQDEARAACDAALRDGPYIQDPYA